MHNEIYTRVMPLPGKIGGFVVRKDDVFTIVVNENHCDEARRKYYQDEINHLARGDMDREESADQIELEAHQ